MKKLEDLKLKMWLSPCPPYELDLTQTTEMWIQVHLFLGTNMQIGFLIWLISSFSEAGKEVHTICSDNTRNSPVVGAS